MLLLLACHVFESAKVECYAGEPCADAKNRPPTLPRIAISPDQPGDADPLLVEITTDAEDPEGERVSYVYRWTRDGVEVPDLGAKVPAAETAVGEVWRVEVSGSDGEQTGGAASAEVEILGPDEPPVISSVTLDPAAPGRSDAITATVDAADPEGAALEIHYLWLLNGVEAVAPDRATLAANLHVPGDHVSVTVTVSDGRTAVEATSAQTDRVDGTSFYRIQHQIQADVEQDRARMDGTWGFSFYSEGPLLGHLDCQALYTLQSSRTRRCDTCDFSFSVQWVIDEGQSVLGPGCEGLAGDPSGVLEFFTAGPSLSHQTEGAPLVVSYRYYDSHIYEYTYYQINYYPGVYVYDGAYTSNPSYINRETVSYAPNNGGTRWDIVRYSYNRQ